MAKQTIYDFIRDWFDFSFENPDLVSPSHTAMYLWLVELNNRMGWAEKFSTPGRQTMDAIGMKSYNTYIKIFRDLVKWEFIIVHQESKNQYSACVIALSKNNKALDKALDKALIKHVIEHTQSIGESTVQSTVQSTDNVIIPNYNRQKTNLQDTAGAPELSPTRGNHCPTWQAVVECFVRLGHPDKAFEFFEYWEALNWMKGITPIVNFASFANRWISNPISQAEKKFDGGRKVIMLHNMSGTEDIWTEQEYQRYCTESGSGYKFLRYE